MIFSQDLVFIHVPKTGGTAIQSLLFQVLPHPFYHTSPEPLPVSKEPGITWIQGRQHENLRETRDIMARYNMDLLKSPVILAAVRNPYARELSGYMYLAARDRPVIPASELALAEDFEGYVCKRLNDIKGNVSEAFYKLDGVIPPNLRILRQENLADDLQQALRDIGIECKQTLKRENTSRHADYTLYYTAASEEAIYRKYKWLFDAGYYERCKPGNVSRLDIVRQELRDMKQTARDRQAEYLDLVATTQKTERWARELEQVTREQQATIQAYRRVLGPFRPLYSLASGLKKRFSSGR